MEGSKEPKINNTWVNVRKKKCIGLIWLNMKSWGIEHDFFIFILRSDEINLYSRISKDNKKEIEKMLKGEG